MYPGLTAASPLKGAGVFAETVVGAPPREPEIVRRVQALDRQAAMTCDAVRELVERLAAVSRPAQPVADTVTKEGNEICHTGVGNILMGIERHLLTLQRTAEDALMRIEL